MRNDSMIREALAADDDAVSGLLLKSFQSLYDRIGVEMSEQRSAYLRDQADRREFATSFVYEKEGRIVGSVTVTPPSEHSEAWIAGAWDLRLLAVDPDMQKHRIATALMVFAEQHATDAGATEICLHSRRGIDAQAKLYLARGYTRDPLGDLEGPPLQDGYRKFLRC